jgi:hypothetical protein
MQFIRRKEMKNKTTAAGICIVVAALVSLTGCISTIDWYKMDLNSPIGARTRLLSLKNATADTDLYQQVEKLTANGYFDTGSEAYGYYGIDLYYTRELPPSWMGWLILNSLTLYLTALIGVPIDSEKFVLNAYLNIFDSSGNLVRSLKKTDSFIQTAGFYYGHDPTKKAGKVYAKLFSDLFAVADMRSEEINHELMAAGPISAGNTSAARTRIMQFKSEISNIGSRN